MNISIIGCGYISYYYCVSLNNYNNINLIGVYDKNKVKRDKLADYNKCISYDSFDDLLNDKSVDIVLNLTNPKYHYELNKEILSNNKN